MTFLFFRNFWPIIHNMFQNFSKFFKKMKWKSIWKKYEFIIQKMKYFEFYFISRKIKMNPEKIQFINRWSTPKKIKKMQNFLKFAGFYQKLIFKFTKIILPLLNLFFKKIIWFWEFAQQNVFGKYKKLFTTAFILKSFDFMLFKFRFKNLPDAKTFKRQYLPNNILFKKIHNRKNQLWHVLRSTVQ